MYIIAMDINNIDIYIYIYFHHLTDRGTLLHLDCHAEKTVSSSAMANKIMIKRASDIATLYK